MAGSRSVGHGRFDTNCREIIDTTKAVEAWQREVAENIARREQEKVGAPA